MPRHTTGCRNCVNRRIRCDESRPVCEKCKKQKLICDGPHQGALFINKRHPSRQSTTRTKFQKSEVKTTPGLDIDSPCRPDESSHQPSTPYLSISLIPTPGTNGFLCFLRKRWEREDREWIDHCLQSPDLYPAAMLALDCLATAFFGKRHRQASIIAQAGCKYGKALVALRNTLQPAASTYLRLVLPFTATNSFFARHTKVGFNTPVESVGS